MTAFNAKRASRTHAHTVTTLLLSLKQYVRLLVRRGWGVGWRLLEGQVRPPLSLQMSIVTLNHSNLPQPQRITTMMVGQPAKQMTIAKTTITAHHDEEQYPWRRFDDPVPMWWIMCTFSWRRRQYRHQLSLPASCDHYPTYAATYIMMKAPAVQSRCLECRGCQRSDEKIGVWCWRLNNAVVTV